SLGAGLEVQRMVHYGLTPAEALTAATKTAAEALGLAEHIGTVEEGKLADLVIVDGDPLTEPGLLADLGRIWLVIQLGARVGGRARGGRVGLAGAGGGPPIPESEMGGRQYTHFVDPHLDRCSNGRLAGHCAGRLLPYTP